MQRSLIRNNLYATVKSNSSVRRIPLSLFLNDVELKLLLDWKIQRLRELATTHINSSENLISTHWEDSNKSLVNFPENLTPEHILLSSNKMSHRLLYAVSTICGHIDPSETIQIYLYYEQESEHLLEMMRVYWKRASFVTKN